MGSFFDTTEKKDASSILSCHYQSLCTRSALALDGNKITINTTLIIIQIHVWDKATMKKHRSLRRNFTSVRFSFSCRSSSAILILFGSMLLMLFLDTNPSLGVLNLVSAYDNGLGLTPQMGWNSWNYFGCNGISETLIKEIAEALISTGLADLGYEYINLDDCWQVSRNKTGYIVEDFQKFPSGMAGLSKYVRNELGLKFGLYSDSGLFTCQRRPGSFGHERQDAESYREWEIDYLKYDNCYATGLGKGVQKRYESMRDALNQTTTTTDHPIFFGLCEWGIQDPATWAGNVGNSWRTTGDIQQSWDSILDNLDKNDKWHRYAGPGGWNDPDMLQVGTTTKLTLEEQRSHFTLWALIKSPLLLANDLRDIPTEILEILSNSEIIALNQDKLGVQGYKRQSQNGLEVWAGDLEGGDIGVVLFNRSPKTETIEVRFKDLLLENKFQERRRNDLSSSISVHVRDLWARSDLGVHRDAFEGVVPSHDVIALRLSGIEVAIDLGSIH